MANKLMTNAECDALIAETIADVEARIATMTPDELKTEGERLDAKARELMALTPRTPWMSQERVTCLDCDWNGIAHDLKAQACPVCDGRCADV